MTDTYVKLRHEVLSGGTDNAPGEEPVGGRRAVIGLSVVAALLVLLGFYSTWALIFVIGLLVSVFFHELGHFVTAKWTGMKATQRSEEHTSELQSHHDLVCRLLLEKKK